MAFEKEKQFLEKMMADEDLRAKVEAADPEQIAEIARTAGFDISAEDLEKAANEARAKDDPEISKLSPEDMDKVAGGSLSDWWPSGEDADDGHEMGCVFVYHYYGWSEENNQWCKSKWFCISNNYSDTATDYYPY